MRPEYDFSGGVRGKHYRAYRKGTAVVHSKKDRHMGTNDEQLPLALKGRKSAGEVLDTIQTASRTEREKGAWFERLFRALALSDGALEIEQIWSWRDWPEREELTGLDARDIGIDLVARTTNGRLVAIQCKCHDRSTYLRKGDIDSFLGGSQHACFDLRWIVSTCRWGPNAEAAIKNAHPPVRRIDFNDYLDTQIEDGSVERPVRQPNPAQRRAIDDVVTGLHNHPRGQLVMACGTGKTYTSLRIAEELAPPGARIVFAAPSIALVSQARKEWLRHAQRPIRSLVVCSDTTAGSDNPDDIRLDEISTPVTTDPTEIERWLRSPIAEGSVQVVFCTYQSLERVTHSEIVFDLAIADEAHRTTGRLDEENPTAFTKFHHELRANKRLYMTATPRIYAPAAKARALDERGVTVVDMDDVKTYGPELHRLSFKDGVEQELLSDYRVIVLGVDEGSVSEALHKNLARVSASEKQSGEASPPTTEEIGRVLGLSLAMNGIIAGTDPEIPGELPRVIAYARSIARSKWYCDAINHPEVRRWTTRRMRKDGGDRGSRVVESQAPDLASWADEDPTDGAQVDGSDQRFVPRDVDIVIMNPPFTNLQDTGTRTGTAGKQAMDAKKAAIRDKLAREDETAARVVHNAKSVSPMFTVLAERALREDRGTLAKVLPVAGAVVAPPGWRSAGCWPRASTSPSSSPRTTTGTSRSRAIPTSTSAWSSRGAGKGRRRRPGSSSSTGCPGTPRRRPGGQRISGAGTWTVSGGASNGQPSACARATGPRCNGTTGRAPSTPSR